MNKLIVAVAAIAALVISPAAAADNAGRCDGSLCVPGVVIIKAYPPAGTPCQSHGGRYVFGLEPGKENTYSYVCSSWNTWVLGQLLVGVRLPGDSCLKGMAAQSPDGLPLLCTNSGVFEVYY